MQHPRIHLSVPHMSEHGAEEHYVHDAFASNWLSTVGPNLEAFEAAFTARLGMPCVALGSGTAAIHLGLRLLGVGPGDEVVVPSLTFIATANPAVYLGARPVLIDSERQSWNMDPELLERCLRERAERGKLPRAVVPVHLYGQTADMDAIAEVCRRYDVPILEDAAEALGASYKGRAAGTLAPIAAFSFNGNKIITTTGGGMLAARDRALIEKARFWSQQARNPGIAYDHTEMGYNYRLSNVLAGIGRGQLEVLDRRVEQRRAVAFRYRDAFADLPGFSLMPEAPWGRCSYWLSVFLVDEAAAGCTRDAVIEALAAENIESRPVWKPLHLQPIFHDLPVYGGAVSAELFRRGICLPSSSSLAEPDQRRIIDVVRAAAARGRTARA
jgi:pyridoxal phosphate-dependent aminotransferase EpsN